EVCNLLRSHRLPHHWSPRQWNRAARRSATRCVHLCSPPRRSDLTRIRKQAVCAGDRPLIGEGVRQARFEYTIRLALALIDERERLIERLVLLLGMSKTKCCSERRRMLDERSPLCARRREDDD